MAADKQHDWGPGRVDTFNAAKVLFNFPLDRLSEHEQNAASDFPSIWYQGPRKGMLQRRPAASAPKA